MTDMTQRFPFKVCDKSGWAKPTCEINLIEWTWSKDYHRKIGVEIRGGNREEFSDVTEWAWPKDFPEELLRGNPLEENDS